MKIYNALSLVSFAALACASPLLGQITTEYTWTGNADNGLWSDDNNWSGTGKPAAVSTRAVLGNAESDRRVVLNSGGGSPGLIGGMRFIQTSAFENVVEIRRSIGVNLEQVVLGASNGGRSVLFLNSTTANQNDSSGNYAGITGTDRLLSAQHGIQINSGGAVIIGKTRNSSSETVVQNQIFNAAVFNINGGELIVQNGVYTAAGNATRMTHNIYTGLPASNPVNLAMTAGRLEVGAMGSAAGTQITDTNLRVDGSINISGGQTLIHLFLSGEAAKVTATGAIVLGGDLLLDLAAITPGGDGTFALFAGASLSGDFSSVSLADQSKSFISLGNGLWGLDHAGFRYEFSARDGILSQTQIPEPAAVWSCGIIGAVVAVSLLRRRRASR